MIVGSITLLIEAESKAIWIYYPSHQAFIACFRLKESLTDIFEIGYYHTDMGCIIFDQNAIYFVDNRYACYFGVNLNKKQF